MWWSPQTVPSLTQVSLGGCGLCTPHDLKLQLCDSFKYSITRYTIMICDRAWEKGANAALSRFVQYTKISIELIVGDN